jgi:hypothetical protein
MASIKITERDLTTPGSTTVNTNVAYVPGYAVMGPVNEPVLCSTVAEFKETFGNVPYKYQAVQVINGTTTFANVGDYEKSYIYAIELLRNGMSVLFERITTNEVKASYTVPSYKSIIEGNGGLIITAKNPGVYGKDISYALTTTEKVFTDIEYAPVILNGTILKADTEIVVAYSTGKYAKLKAVTDVNGDEEGATVGLVKVYPETDDDKDVIDEFVSDNFSGLTFIGTSLDLVKSVVVDDDVTLNTSIVKGSSVKAYSDEYTLYVKIGSEYTDGRTYSYNFSTNINSANYVNAIQFDLVDVKLDLPVDFYWLNLSEKVDGVPVYTNLNYVKAGNEFSVSELYSYLEKGTVETTETQPELIGVNRLVDRLNYPIKFITGGGYPILNQPRVVEKYLKIAGTRGDAIALIDHNVQTAIATVHTTVKALEIPILANGEDPMKYGAMFTPWGSYTIKDLNTIVDMPASFAYLKAYANAVKTNASWNAVAGVTRGKVTDLVQLKPIISGAMADRLQSRIGVSINPITEIKPYGNCIWGNRTLFNNRKELTASSFLNIRMLSNDIKKKVFDIANELTFELNSEILWLNFKSKLIPTLDQMVSGNGLSGYKIIKTPTDKKATVACTIKLYAIEAVEDWDITIELSDSYISVE